MPYTYPRESAEFGASTTTAGEQSTPSVGALPDSKYIIAWTSHLQDGSGYGIYSQSYDSSGHRGGAETRVSRTSAGGQDSDAEVRGSAS